jgi:hypothetical protein
VEGEDPDRPRHAAEQALEAVAHLPAALFVNVIARLSFGPHVEIRCATR